MVLAPLLRAAGTPSGPPWRARYSHPNTPQAAGIAEDRLHLPYGVPRLPGESQVSCRSNNPDAKGECEVRGRDNLLISQQGGEMTRDLWERPALRALIEIYPRFELHPIPT